MNEHSSMFRKELIFICVFVICVTVVLSLPPRKRSNRQKIIEKMHKLRLYVQLKEKLKGRFKRPDEYEARLKEIRKEFSEELRGMNVS